MSQDVTGTGRLRTPAVLMYHSISSRPSPDPHRLRLRPERLDQHLRVLRRLGLRGVSLSELLAAQQRGAARGLVGLTFDDGYVDYVEEALPVLQRHGATSTVYVVAGDIGQVKRWGSEPRWPMMDADQLRRVVAAGHEVGSHTMTHPRLAGADATTLQAEVAGSKELLEELLQAPVPGFAYPYGNFDAAAAQAVRAAGHDHACVTGDYDPGDRFTLPRCYVSPGDTAAHVLVRLARHRARSHSPRRHDGAAPEGARR